MATQTTTSTQAPGGPREPFPPFDTAKYGSQLLWLALAFGLLYWLSAKVLLPRIGAILETRRDRIHSDLDEAERFKAESEAAKTTYEKALADARANAAKLAQETRDELARELDAKKVQIETRMAERLAEAETRIAGIRTTAMGEVGTIATDTTDAILSKLVGPIVGKADVSGAVADALAKR